MQVLVVARLQQRLKEGEIKSNQLDTNTNRRITAARQKNLFPISRVRGALPPPPCSRSHPHPRLCSRSRPTTAPAPSPSPSVWNRVKALFPSKNPWLTPKPMFPPVLHLCRYSCRQVVVLLAQPPGPTPQPPPLPPPQDQAQDHAG